MFMLNVCGLAVTNLRMCASLLQNEVGL